MIGMMRAEDIELDFVYLGSFIGTVNDDVLVRKFRDPSKLGRINRFHAGRNDYVSAICS
jgi:hypothetical protein